MSRKESARRIGLASGLPARDHRPELDGLRGLALLGVVLFHYFGNGRVSGGIDIFLAISGFLFTGMLLRESVQSGGTIDLWKYFARLVRRIIIPAVIVVLSILAVGLLIQPSTKFPQLFAESRASLLYVENFELINSQLAYGAAGPASSPFQHFWSLSVQGQFYLIWPLVTVVAVYLAKRLRTSAVLVMASLIGVIVIVSFLLAIRIGDYNQDAAYLMTVTRAWEIGFGGVLALFGATVRLPRAWRFFVGWIGLALVVSCGFFIDGAMLFPGPWALWPLVGFALVMVASNPSVESVAGPHSKWSSHGFLSAKPLAWIAQRAYAIYLWHWPLLVFYLEIRSKHELSVSEAVGLLIVALVLAMLMYRFVEKPLKVAQTFGPYSSGSDRKTVNRMLVVTAVLLLTASSVGLTALNRVSEAEKQIGWDFDNYPGALSLYNGEAVPKVDQYLPSTGALRHEKAAFYERNCYQPMGNEPGTDRIQVCEDPNRPENPSATIVLSGGSHAGHWYRAWEVLAEKYNWELLVVNKDACVFQAVSDTQNDMCQSWNANYMEWLLTADVDLVVTPGTRMLTGEPEVIWPGAQDRWEEITATGTHLLLMRGTPRPGGTQVDDCLAGGNTPVECGADSNQIAERNPMELVTLPDKAFYVDLTDYVCPAVLGEEEENCSAVVGNVVVWYDGSHLTNAYVETLTPILEEQLVTEAAWLFE
ncbi:acyltransferase family protein [Gulosibacter chungangensis]|uniref:acyltransferase family protein n=1 Tax=Gulosibacter chungangensis TaxID=979746 RepID=UPI001788470A|nr:acyltransferase family protein [Gulosibacter chungangensis]